MSNHHGTSDTKVGETQVDSHHLLLGGGGGGRPPTQTTTVTPSSSSIGWSLFVVICWCSIVVACLALLEHMVVSWDAARIRDRMLLQSRLAREYDERYYHYYYSANTANNNNRDNRQEEDEEEASYDDMNRPRTLEPAAHEEEHNDADNDTNNVSSSFGFLEQHYYYYHHRHRHHHHHIHDHHDDIQDSAQNDNNDNDNDEYYGSGDHPPSNSFPIIQEDHQEAHRWTKGCANPVAVQSPFALVAVFPSTDQSIARSFSSSFSLFMQYDDVDHSFRDSQEAACKVAKQVRALPTTLQKPVDLRLLVLVPVMTVDEEEGGSNNNNDNHNEGAPNGTSASSSSFSSSSLLSYSGSSSSRFSSPLFTAALESAEQCGWQRCIIYHSSSTTTRIMNNDDDGNLSDFLQSYSAVLLLDLALYPLPVAPYFLDELFLRELSSMRRMNQSIAMAWDTFPLNFQNGVVLLRAKALEKDVMRLTPTHHHYSPKPENTSDSEYYYYYTDDNDHHDHDNDDGLLSNQSESRSIHVNHTQKNEDAEPRLLSLFRSHALLFRLLKYYYYYYYYDNDHHHHHYYHWHQGLDNDNHDDNGDHEHDDHDDNNNNNDHDGARPQPDRLVHFHHHGITVHVLRPGFNLPAQEAAASSSYSNALILRFDVPPWNTARCLMHGIRTLCKVWTDT